MLYEVITIAGGKFCCSPAADVAIETAGTRPDDMPDNRCIGMGEMGIPVCFQKSRSDLHGLELLPGLEHGMAS